MRQAAGGRACQAYSGSFFVSVVVSISLPAEIVSGTCCSVSQWIPRKSFQSTRTRVGGFVAG